MVLICLYGFGVPIVAVIGGLGRGDGYFARFGEREVGNGDGCCGGFFQPFLGDDFFAVVQSIVSD